MESSFTIEMFKQYGEPDFSPMWNNNTVSCMGVSADCYGLFKCSIMCFIVKGRSRVFP